MSQPFMFNDLSFYFPLRRSKRATGGRTLKTRLGWMAGRRCLRQRPKSAVDQRNVESTLMEMLYKR